jgi:hypothetical protein
MKRLCVLEQVARGEATACLETDCPFWEPGGAVLAGRCALDEVDLAGRADVARELLGVRDRLRTLHADDREKSLLLLYRRLLKTSDDS